MYREKIWRQGIFTVLVLKQKVSFNVILLTIVITDIRKLKFQFRMHFKYSDFDHDLGLKNQRRSL